MWHTSAADDVRVHKAGRVLRNPTNWRLAEYDQSSSCSVFPCPLVLSHSLMDDRRCWWHRHRNHVTVQGSPSTRRKYEALRNLWRRRLSLSAVPNSDTPSVRMKRKNNAGSVVSPRHDTVWLSHDRARKFKGWNEAAPHWLFWLILCVMHHAISLGAKLIYLHLMMHQWWRLLADCWPRNRPIQD